jgi:phosphoadenosine phosphosulfate reductase
MGRFSPILARFNRDFILAPTLVYAVSRLIGSTTRPVDCEAGAVVDGTDGGRYDVDCVMSADTIAETSGETLNEVFARLDVGERLAWLAKRATGPMVFTTSFGLEDQVLTHLLVSTGIDCRFATLDTGRLFPETHAVWAETEQRYGVQVEAFYPRSEALASLVRMNGINGFYHSIDARHACCGVRKVEPLNRALHGASVWLTGLRADQSGNRQVLDFVSFDAGRGLLKVNPLLDWTRDQVETLVRSENVPYNALHDRGFLSIGCAPCTRAVTAGESERAGRWWWEQDETRECGLHLTQDGRLVRRS